MDLIIPSNGYNIPRNQLPQVAAADIPEFLKFLDRSDIHVELVGIQAERLKPSQAEFNHEKIHKLMGVDPENLKKPVIISSDEVLLDGHHRWAALYNFDRASFMDAYKVDLPFFALLNVTKQFPKAFYKTVTESIVFTFGRFQPPTKGHEKIIREAARLADDADLTVFVSHTQDSKKNPLLQEARIELIEKMVPNVMVTPLAEGEGLIQLLSRLCEQGYSDVTLVAGDDRVPEYQRLANKYNGKEYFFESIQIVSAGQRDPDSDGIEGLSGSKMRLAAINNNFNDLREGMSSSLSDSDVKRVMEEIQHTLNENFASFLQEELLVEGHQDKGIFKAVFIAGGSGSGKDFVMKQALDGHGLVEIPSEKALAYLQDKGRLDKSMADDIESQRNFIRNKSKSIGDLRGRLAIQGRNGLIINGSASEFETTKKIKDRLEHMGYETKMVFVNTSNEVSKQRNSARALKGGRQIPEKKRAAKWAEAQDARVKYEQLFGKEHFIHFDNSEDLAGESDSKRSKDILDRHAAKYQELVDIRGKIKEFATSAPKHDVAQTWIQKEQGAAEKQQAKAAKAKPQAKAPAQKSAAAPQKPTSKQPTQTAQPEQPLTAMKHPGRDEYSQAKNMGLEYYGFGRYGSGGKVTHLSIDGKLVRKPQNTIATPASKKPKTVKSIKEQAHEYLSENNSINNGISPLESDNQSIQSAGSVSSTSATDRANKSGSQDCDYTIQEGKDKKKAAFKEVLKRLKGA